VCLYIIVTGCVSHHVQAQNELSTLHIITPAEGATIRNNTQTVPVKLNQAALQLPIAMWEIRLNNVVLLEDDALPNTLYPVYRGTHTLVVNGYNKTGKLIARSKPITFYKHQAIQK
jgi:hypothetical protein